MQKDRELMLDIEEMFGKVIEKINVVHAVKETDYSH
jgi:hypothetical protein